GSENSRTRFHTILNYRNISRWHRDCVLPAECHAHPLVAKPIVTLTYGAGETLANEPEEHHPRGRVDGSDRRAFRPGARDPGWASADRQCVVYGRLRHERRSQRLRGQRVGFRRSSVPGYGDEWTDSAIGISGHGHRYNRDFLVYLRPVWRLHHHRGWRQFGRSVSVDG